MDSVAPVDVAVVIPNFNGERWLPGVLESVAAQTAAPAEVVVVDDASTDASRALLAERFPHVRVVALRRQRRVRPRRERRDRRHAAEAVALVNTDVVLDPRWLETARAALAGHPGAASVATKLVDLADRDAALRRRRRAAARRRLRAARPLRARQGRYDEPGEVFAACAGAALYRRAAVAAAGGFDERLGIYLEDVDLGLRLRLAGWSCRWEPRAVAAHAGRAPSGGAGAWVERNTLLLVARAFPLRWLPYVAYRQAAWAWHAARAGELRTQLAGVRAALPLLPAFAARARRVPRRAAVPVERVVPARPIRGPRAGGHPSRHAR